MEWIEIIIEALVSFAAVAAAVWIIYFGLNRYFAAQTEKLNRDWMEKKEKDFLPIQTQAYERLILFLERIHPERLVFRVNKPGMSARLMQAEILKLIREEFDHNLAQQLYISNDAWNAVKAAREETFKILNHAAEKTDSNASSFDFSTAIIETVDKLEKIPTEVAVNILKAEFRRRQVGIRK
jgi:hypothetical protein